MSLRFRRALCLLSVGPVLATASCSTEPVDASPAAHASDASCRKASSGWPKKVGDAEAYPVTSPSDSVRAWGTKPSDAVIARCGVDSPGPTTDACIQVDDVDWVQSAVSGGYRFVTYGRQPALEVLVPKAASDTPGLLLPAFTTAARSLPQGSHRCE